MKKILYSLLVICLTLVSCNETKQSEIEKLAIESFKMSYAQENKDINYETFKTVFYTQNLCILHIEDDNKNAPTKVEYLFFTQDGKNYEAIQDLSKDSIFVSESTLREISGGTIYENQEYATAIVFRAVEYISLMGREVGNHSTDFFLNSPMETGIWNFGSSFDEFGDKVGENGLVTIGKGTYSDDYNTNERLFAALFADKLGNIGMKLFEEGNGEVKKFGNHIKIKDSEGIIHEIYITDSSFGFISPFSIEEKLELLQIVEKEGIMSAIAEVDGGWFSSNKTTYKFKFNLTGFRKAMKFLRPNEDNTSDSDYENSDIESESAEEEIKENIKFNPPQISGESDPVLELESPEGLE
jgi:hypothetical protein